jgi:hypothetical protein
MSDRLDVAAADVVADRTSTISALREVMVFDPGR